MFSCKSKDRLVKFRRIVTTGFFQVGRWLFNRSVRELMTTSYDIILGVIDENVYGRDFRSDCILSANNSVEVIVKKV